MTHPLDNLPWNTLTGPHAAFAAGSGAARRYAAGFSPIVGFADQAAPDFSGLAGCSAPGERFYCDGWTGAAPPGWRVEVDATMFKMIWQGRTPDEDPLPGAVRLGPQHVEQAVALATLTRPGPFGPRTIELGDYFGVFDGERLVAMAGERMRAGDFREISGVCTHPDRQGQGLARRLVEKMLLRGLARGERPFLQVMTANEGAWRLYERMGFAVYRQSPVRVVARV